MCVLGGVWFLVGFLFYVGCVVCFVFLGVLWFVWFGVCLWVFFWCLWLLLVLFCFFVGLVCGVGGGGVLWVGAFWSGGVGRLGAVMGWCSLGECFLCYLDVCVLLVFYVLF